MIGARIERWCWTIVIGASIWAWKGWLTSLPSHEPTLVPIPDAPAPPTLYPLEMLYREATTVVETNPFRLDRRPAAVPYDPGGGQRTLSPPPPSAPKPVLALAGTVGGPPWAALIEGMPGREGSTLVHQGDSVGELQIKLVTRDSVIVEGADTTWILKLKREWQ